MPNFSGLNPPTIRPKYRDQPMGDESGDSTGPSRGGPSRKIKRVNTKRKGELSEAAFLLKAAGLCFGVAKPWGDSERYDFILDSHGLDSHKNDSHNNDSHGHDSHNHDSHKNDLHNHAVDRRLWRVQLKCTEVVRARGYDVSPSTPSTGKARWFTPPTTLTFLSPTSSRSISGTCSPSRPSRPAKAFASILKADANVLASSTIARPGICCARIINNRFTLNFVKDS